MGGFYFIFSVINSDSSSAMSTTFTLYMFMLTLKQVELKKKIISGTMLRSFLVQKNDIRIPMLNSEFGNLQTRETHQQRDTT